MSPSVSKRVRPLVDDSDIERRILDAAASLAATRGDNRMTIDDVAAAAGVGRATVFRRFGSKDGLLTAVNLRDMRRAIEDLETVAVSATDPAAGTVAIFIEIVRIARSHPRVQRLIKLEPELLLAAAVNGDPGPLELVRRFIANWLYAWQRSGALSGSNPDQLADFVSHLALSYVVAPSLVVDLGEPAALRAFAESVIAPAIVGRVLPET